MECLAIHHHYPSSLNPSVENIRVAILDVILPEHKQHVTDYPPLHLFLAHVAFLPPVLLEHSLQEGHSEQKLVIDAKDS